MMQKELHFGERIANIARSAAATLSIEIDMKKLRSDRNYLSFLQTKFLKDLLFNAVSKEPLAAQIYFQFAPETTPQLAPDEFGAGVCLENTGNWQVCEHNMSYIRDFSPDNEFLKWWYFESIRIRDGGWTRAYFDPYMRIEVITFSMPVYSCFSGFEDTLMGVLGIDIDYNDFRQEMNRRLVENIKTNIESIKKDFELVGDKEALSNQFININTFEIVGQKDLESNFVIRSQAMENVMLLAVKASLSDATVLLQGETGVGKDFIANFIHSKSKFCSGPIININCSALPESLAESEFFGYGKGAFTGAQAEGKAGYFEAASGGTVFLNEISDLPLHMQSKLLNVIQERKVTRVGETLPRNTNFRLIAATNKNLSQSVNAGSFREDLYYRLHVIPILIPPLRERRDDIFSLLNYFLAKNTEKYKVDKRLSIELTSLLLHYEWPGNIRELENLMERLVLTSNGLIITEQDLPKEFAERLYSMQLPKRPTLKVPGSQSLKSLLEEAEAEIIRTTYQKHKSSYRLAKALSISQSQAYQKIKKYISPKELNPDI